MSIQGLQYNLESVRSSVPEKKPRKRGPRSGPTIGQISEKISSLKSRIAVTETLIVYLETHFQGIDGDDPEEYVTREDYARVSPAHIAEYVASLQEACLVYESELEEWEGMPISQPQTQKKSASNDQDSE